MDVRTFTRWEDLPQDAAVAVFFRGSQPTDPELWNFLVHRYQGVPARVLERKKWKGKVNDVVTIPLPDRDGVPLYVVGLEDNARETSTESLRRSCGTLGRILLGDRVHQLAVWIPTLDDDPWMSVRAVVEGIRLGQYTFRKYQPETEEPQPVPLRTLWLTGIESARVEPAVSTANIVVDAVVLARDLINEPANELYPARFAEIAETYAHASGLAIRVYDEVALESLGAGAFLSVGRGSARPPRMIHLHYRPESAPNGPVLGLVGKGITFDSGGLNLKSTSYMQDMKGDMSGAAAVLATLWAVARLHPPVEVHGVLCCAENMPSGSASRPGDVVRAMNGKTIEITNTDAEGRLVLADGLVYTARQGVDRLIDVATLTGAAVVALGTQVAAVLSNDTQLQDAFLAAARRAGESFWPLPLEKTYRELMKSEIATIKNSSNAREAGTITGAIFLHEFVEGKPWIHLDIAGPFWANKAMHYLSPGGTGFSTRSLIQFVLDTAAQ